MDSASILVLIGFIGGNALPGLFWLVSLRIFGDHHSLSKVQYLIASSTLLIPILFKLAHLFLPLSHSEQLALQQLGQVTGLLIELVLICHALYISALHWHNDLVLERRFIRGGVITLAAIYIMLVILAEQVLKLNSPFVDWAKTLGVLLLTSAINLLLFKPKSSTLFEAKHTQPTAHTPQNRKLLSALLKAMTEQKLYQQDGLTIVQLAHALGSQDYLLRNLINKELGYRNFNDFLNKYRIEQVASKIKSDPGSDTAILTLALESGFRSLSAFNRAFKQIHQVTPTEFRKKHLADY